MKEGTTANSMKMKSISQLRRGGEKNEGSGREKARKKRKKQETRRNKTRETKRAGKTRRKKRERVADRLRSEMKGAGLKEAKAEKLN